MAVEDALGMAGRAGRVAHRAGLVLVHVDELRGLRRGQERLVVERAFGARTGRVVDHDRVADGAHAPRHLLPGRPKALVHDHDLILRVLHDVGQVLGEEADVQRVQDGAQARHADVGLHVLLVVPAERGHARVGADAEAAQGGDEPARSRQHLGERRHPETVGRLRRHGLARVHALGVAHDHGDVEGTLLHQALHGEPP